MENLKHWKILEEVSLVEAIALILGYNPQKFQFGKVLENSNTARLLYRALKDNILSGDLSVTYDNQEYLNDVGVSFDEFHYNIDYYTRVKIADIKQLLAEYDIPSAIIDVSSQEDLMEFNAYVHVGNCEEKLLTGEVIGTSGMSNGGIEIITVKGELEGVEGVYTVVDQRGVNPKMVYNYYLIPEE